jgi:hypothetical protein
MIPLTIREGKNENEEKKKCNSLERERGSKFEK